MKDLLLIVNLFLVLPWWAACLVLAGIAATFAGAVMWLIWRLKSIPNEVINEMSLAFAEGKVNVHSAVAAPRPNKPSAFDMDPDDEDYVPEIDGPQVWGEEGNFYWIDATFTPTTPESEWKPTALTLFPADFDGEIGDASEDMGPMHTLEIFRDGHFEPIVNDEEEVVGQQRLRMLIAGPGEQRRAKFNYMFRCFGEPFSLPAPFPQPASAKVR